MKVAQQTGTICSHFANQVYKANRKLFSTYMLNARNQMSLTVAKVKAESGQIYCPFSGEPVDKDGEINPLPSLLFVHYGDAGLYAYSSPCFLELVRQAGLECEGEVPSDPPETIAPAIETTNAFVLEVDTGWNGVNAYGFAVPS
jgi:hypothetical protein